tara:strand:- start:523 stop:828 length:306 start_codon:yes stop_codon:yes gene_type:complete
LIRDKKCQEIFNLLVIHFEENKEGLTTKQIRTQLGSKRKEMPKGTFYIHVKHLKKDGHISSKKDKKKAKNSKTIWLLNYQQIGKKVLKTVIPISMTCLEKY